VGHSLWTSSLALLLAGCVAVEVVGVDCTRVKVKINQLGATAVECVAESSQARPGAPPARPAPASP